MTIANKNPTTDVNNSQQPEGCGIKVDKSGGTTNNDTSLTFGTGEQGTMENRDCGENQGSNKTSTSATSEQDMKTKGYLAQDCVVVIVMASSTVDKDTTIKNIQQKGYTVLDQHSLSLSSKHTDTLYAYNKAETKPHYQALYDGWMKNSLSGPVQVVILGKENAVQSFQDLMNKQNSTKKKDRILDTQSVYASTSQDNVKRDIELLLGTQESNNRGEPVSSATAGENQDDTVTQTPLEANDEPFEKSISTEESNPAALPHENNPSNSVEMAKSISDISISKQRPVMMTMAVTAVTSTTMATATFDVASPIETPPTSVSPKKDPFVPTSAPLNDQISTSSMNDGNDEDDKLLVNEFKTEKDTTEPQHLDQPTSPPSANMTPPTTTSTKSASESMEDTAATTKSTAEPLTVPTMNTVTTTQTQSVSSNTGVTTTETHVVSTKDIVTKIESTIDPPIPASEELNGNCGNNGSSVSYSASADNSGDVQQITDSATKTKSLAKTAAVTRQESRDPLHSKDKQSKETAVRPTAKKVAPTETKAQPTLPIKSKPRRTAPPTIVAEPSKVEKSPSKQQQPPTSNNSNKKPTDETKKKAVRIPRVALLANQTKPTMPQSATDEQQKQKAIPPKTTRISRDAIARLTAPTASSIRRQQGTSAAPPPPTTPTKGTSVTATFKVEQRKRRMEPVSAVKATVVKTATPVTKQPSPTSTSRLSKQALTKKKTNDVDSGKKTETSQKVTKKPSVPKKRETGTTATTTTKKALTTIDTSAAGGPGTEKDATTTDAEKVVDDTAIPSPSATANTKQTLEDNDKQTKAEQSPLSPADSSTTSSRPQTPDHSSQDRATSDHAATTTATTTSTGMVTLNATPIKTLDHHHHQQKPPVTISKVKNMLTQFM